MIYSVERLLIQKLGGGGESLFVQLRNVRSSVHDSIKADSKDLNDCGQEIE